MIIVLYTIIIVQSYFLKKLRFAMNFLAIIPNAKFVQKKPQERCCQLYKPDPSLESRGMSVVSAMATCKSFFVFFYRFYYHGIFESPLFTSIWGIFVGHFFLLHVKQI